MYYNNNYKLCEAKTDTTERKNKTYLVITGDFKTSLSATDRQLDRKPIRIWQNTTAPPTTRI